MHIPVAMAWMAEPYRNAIAIGNNLMLRAVSQGTEPKDAALLARVWIEIERFKREMRGLPPLAASSLRELAEAKRASMKRVSIASSSSYEEITEAEPSKESISRETVPTPPTPEAPSAQVVDDDK